MFESRVTNSGVAWVDLRRAGSTLILPLEAPQGAPRELIHVHPLSLLVHLPRALITLVPNV